MPKGSKKKKNSRKKVAASAGPTEKQLKAALKEGGKKGQDISGISDLGGVSCFHISLETCEGRMDLLHEALKGFNREVDEAAEDRKGGAGGLAKFLFTYDDKKVTFLCHVPAVMKEKLKGEAWVEVVVGSLGGKVTKTFELDGGNVWEGGAPGNPDANKFPIKMRDAAINDGFNWLKSQQLVCDDDSEDDEMVFGDDDFPDYDDEPAPTPAPAAAAAAAAAAPVKPAPAPAPVKEQKPKKEKSKNPVPTPKQKKPYVKSAVAAEKKAEPVEPAHNPYAGMPMTDDVAWCPWVPMGHTAFSWECDDDDEEECEAAPACRSTPVLPPRPTRPASKELAGCKVLGEASGSLKWNKTQPVGSLLDLPDKEAARIVEVIERCIRTRSHRCSQGLHDRYVKYCTVKSRKVVKVLSGKSQYQQALTMLFGIGSTQLDKATAVELLAETAKDKVAEAISLLGYCYQYGDGVKADNKRAIALYKESAALDDPHGKVRLGRSHWTQLDGLAQDRETSRALIETGLVELHARVDGGQLEEAERSRALTLIHTQFALL